MEVFESRELILRGIPLFCLNQCKIQTMRQLGHGRSCQLFIAKICEKLIKFEFKNAKWSKTVSVEFMWAHEFTYLKSSKRRIIGHINIKNPNFYHLPKMSLLPHCTIQEFTILKFT